MLYKPILYVVGGGIAGLSTAFAWQQLGGQSIVLESKICGSGATGAAAGMLAPTLEADPAEPWLNENGPKALETHLRWANLLGATRLARQGMLEVAVLPEELPLLRRQYDWLTGQGRPVEWLQGKALQAKEALLSPHLTAGIWAPEDCQIDNRMLVSSLRRAILQNGGQVIEKLGQLSGWQSDGRGVHLSYAQHQFQADRVVFATGVQVVWNQPLKVRAVKGQMLSLFAGKTGAPGLPVRIRSRALGNGYLVPKQDRLIVGSTSEEQANDANLTAGGMLDLLRRAYAAVPLVYEMPILETWVGHRPATASNLPECVKPNDSPIWFLNGLYRHGILLGPLMGERTAAAIWQTL